MPRTEEQREVESLLSNLEDAEGLPAEELRRKLVRICRVQQEEIREFQDFLKNVGFGFKVVGTIGAVTGFIISAVGGVLAIMGFFKS